MTAPTALNALLVPVGTPGDVQPFVDLGLALKARGHRVTLLANEYFATTAQRNGFDFAPTGTRENYEQLLADKSLWNPAKAHRVFAKWLILPELRATYRALAERFEPGRTVVAAQTMAFGARIAQDKLGLPLATIHRQPAVLRSLHQSSAAPYMFLPDWLPRPWKALQFQIMDMLMDHPFVSELDALRDELGLPRVRRIGHSWIHSPARLLCFWPDWFAPPQVDWPKQAKFLGFIARETGERDASDDLRKFLESGERPIVFTFGSGVKQAAHLYAAASDACKSIGLRGVLVTRFREQVPAELPANVIHTSYAPFSWLLPRGAAVVHHGGIGTVGQSLAAGIPQVCVPGLVFDTIDNARRLKMLGVARVLPLRRCSAETMSSTIRKLLDDKTVAQRCKHFARRVHEVDAIQCACDELEAIAGFSPSPGTPGEGRVRVLH